jgi:hypothetical protein
VLVATRKAKLIQPPYEPAGAVALNRTAWRVVRSRGTLKVNNPAKTEETMNAYSRLLALAAAVGALLMPSDATRAQLLITGNDEKVSFDENSDKTITHPPGKDTVSIIDIADPAKPKIVVNQARQRRSMNQLVPISSPAISGKVARCHDRGGWKAVTVHTEAVKSSSFVVSRPNCSSTPAN